MAEIFATSHADYADYTDDDREYPYDEFGECLPDEIIPENTAVAVDESSLGAEAMAPGEPSAEYVSVTPQAWTLAAVYPSLVKTFWQRDALGLRAAARSAARAVLGEGTTASLENILDGALNNPVSALVAGAENLWSGSGSVVAESISEVADGLTGAWNFFAGEEAPSLGDYYRRTTVAEVLLPSATTDDFFSFPGATALYSGSDLFPRETTPVIERENDPPARDERRTVKAIVSEKPLNVYLQRIPLFRSANNYLPLLQRPTFNPAIAVPAETFVVAKPEERSVKPVLPSEFFPSAGDIQDTQVVADSAAFPVPAQNLTVIAVHEPRVSAWVKMDSPAPVPPGIVSEKTAPKDATIVPPVPESIAGEQPDFPVTSGASTANDGSPAELSAVAGSVLKMSGEIYLAGDASRNYFPVASLERAPIRKERIAVAAMPADETVSHGDPRAYLSGSGESGARNGESSPGISLRDDSESRHRVELAWTAPRESERFIPAAQFMIRQGAGGLRSESEVLRDRVALSSTLARRLETVASADDLAFGGDGSQGRPDWSEMLRQNATSVKTERPQVRESGTGVKIRPIRVTDTVLV